MRKKSPMVACLSGVAAGLLWLGLLMAGWVYAQPGIPITSAIKCNEFK